MSKLKRSSAVPLSLVPALAALAACNSGPQVISGVDPCLPDVYNQLQCDYAVQHHGYYYGGMWYHHVYTSPALFYYNGYTHYIGTGGRVRVVSPSSYSHSLSPSSSRSTVVRGGFGGIGGARGFSGS